MTEILDFKDLSKDKLLLLEKQQCILIEAVGKLALTRGQHIQLSKHKSLLRKLRKELKKRVDKRQKIYYN